MAFVYVLFSARLNKYYVGSCRDLSARLKLHSEGKSRYTRSGLPWELKYVEEYATISEAMSREHAIKKMKSRVYIETLIAGEG